MSNTRTVDTWLNNDSQYYRPIQDEAQRLLDEACEAEEHGPTAKSEAAEALASFIETLVEASRPSAEGLWGELITDALRGVDFDEIARDWLADFQVFSVFSSTVEEAKLFTSLDEAKGYLEEKLDSDNTMHAGAFLKLAALQVGGSVDIDGVTYCVGVC